MNKECCHILSKFCTCIYVWKGHLQISFYIMFHCEYFSGLPQHGPIFCPEKGKKNNLISVQQILTTKKMQTSSYKNIYIKPVYVLYCIVSFKVFTTKWPTLSSDIETSMIFLTVISFNFWSGEKYWFFYYLYAREETNLDRLWERNPFEYLASWWLSVKRIKS